MSQRAPAEWKSLCNQPELRLRKLPDGDFARCANRGWDGQVLALEWLEEPAKTPVQPGDPVEIESELAYSLGEATDCRDRRVLVFVEQVADRAAVSRIVAHWKSGG
jgi:hypothetical protein